MKIAVITLCKDEEILLPFFLRHYDPIADEIYMFDNGSTDRSLEIAKTNKKVVVDFFDTQNKIKNNEYLRIKNNFFKTLDADWFIVVDMDEFVYHPDLCAYLTECERIGVTIPKTKGYNMLGAEVPQDDGVTPLIHLLKEGVSTDVEPHLWKLGADFMGTYSKKAIFHRSVTEINYRPGCHESRPVGAVRYSENADVLLLHYKWLSRDYGSGVYARCKRSDEDIKSFGNIPLATRLSYYDKQFPRREQVPEL